MTSVLITGIGGLRNRGVEALVQATIDELRHRRPGIEIGVLTRAAAHARGRLAGKAVDVVDDRTSYRRSRRRIARVATNLLRVGFTGSLRDRLAASSLVIASGGDVFSSDYGSLDRHLEPLRLADLEKVPFAFSAQSIGPFRSRAEAAAWAAIARRSVLVTVRESLSYGYVTEELGLAPGLVRWVADPAFLLDTPQGAALERLRADHGITDAGEPTVALALSDGICGFAGVDAQAHLREWKRIGRWLLEVAGARLLLVPHVQEIGHVNDDRRVAGKLRALLGGGERVTIAGDLSAGELKGLIGGCEMVVGERMHACIAGLSSGVCTVVVGYSVKAQGIVGDVIGRGPESDHLLVPIKALVSGGALERVQQAWTGRQAVAARLEAALPGVRAAAGRNFDLLLERIPEGR